MIDVYEKNLLLWTIHFVARAAETESRKCYPTQQLKKWRSWTRAAYLLITLLWDQADSSRLLPSLIDHCFTGLFCDDVRTAVNHNDEKFVNLIHFVDSIYYFTACMELIKIFYNYIQHMRNFYKNGKESFFEISSIYNLLIAQHSCS